MSLDECLSQREAINARSRARWSRHRQVGVPHQPPSRSSTSCRPRTCSRRWRSRSRPTRRSARPSSSQRASSCRRFNVAEARSRRRSSRPRASGRPPSSMRGPEAGADPGGRRPRPGDRHRLRRHQEQRPDAAAARRPPARHAEQVRGQPELEGGGAVRVGRPDGRRPGAALGARQRAGGERGALGVSRPRTGPPPTRHPGAGSPRGARPPR